MQSRPAIQKLQGEPAAAVTPRRDIFPAGVAGSAEYQDPDAALASLAEWNNRAAQLQRGPFHAVLSVANTGLMQFHRSECTPALLVTGHPPKETFSFAMQRGGNQPVLWQGDELAACDIITADGGQEIDLQSRGPFDLVIVSCEQTLFNEQADILSGREFRFGDPSPRTLTQPLRSNHFLASWIELLNNALQLTTRLAETAIAAQLEAETIELLVQYTAPATKNASLAERRRAALLARKHMLLNVDEPMTITQICGAVHATERTLHLGFKEAFGLSPKQFLKSLRLNAVRRDLQQAQADETVTSLACRRGFFHFSNFAAEYRRLFGELPSQTLHRARTE